MNKAPIHAPPLAEPLESAVPIECDGHRLWGILARPPEGVAQAPLAVLIAVGGPQYRVGSHRQFVRLARALARRGFVSLRFDFRGMGDSEGAQRNFEQVEDDLHCGIDALVRLGPPASKVVVWGLCDAAAAALMFSATDPRVAGLVAANPWARSAASLGAARVKHYYGARLLEPAFWAKLLRGGLDWRASLASLRDNLRQASRHHAGGPAARAPGTFQARMARGLAALRGRLLLIVSENDLTALEFLQYTAGDPAWKELLADAKVQRVDIPEADHTFSRRVWAERAESETIAWLSRLADDAAVGHRPQ